MNISTRLMLYGLAIIASGCGDGTESKNQPSKTDSAPPAVGSDTSLEMSQAELESRLVEGSWVVTSGSGSRAGESFAFTFRPDNTVAGRIYSDYDDTPVVRKWKLEESDISGWFRLAISIDRDQRMDNESAFHWLRSGSLIRLDPKNDRLLVSGDDTVADASVFLQNVAGEVSDDAWFPRAIK